jgi:hypothetical protein
LKEKLRLGSERTSSRIFRKIIGLEIVKQITRSSVRMRAMSDWTLWRGQPPLKRKKSLLTALAEGELEMWEHRPL